MRVQPHGLRALLGVGGQRRDRAECLGVGPRVVVEQSYEQLHLRLGAIAPGYYSPEKNARRQAINEFIRGGGADGVVDFEAAVRDPGHPLQLLARFKGADNLHLNDAGYQAMAAAVNLALLR